MIGTPRESEGFWERDRWPTNWGSDDEDPWSDTEEVEKPVRKTEKSTDRAS